MNSIPLRDTQTRLEGARYFARIVATCCMAAVSAVQAGAATVAQPNRPAPAFVLQGRGDRQLTLHSFARKPIVINVFASWCPPCRQELPGIIAAARANHAVAFLGVDEQEPVEIGARFAAAMKIPYPIAFDAGQFAASYGANALPETIFIGADGIVRAIHHGAISRAELERRIAAFLPPAQSFSDDRFSSARRRRLQAGS